MKNILFILAVLFFPLFASGQVNNKGVPYVVNYSRDDYKASTQNWAVVQDNRGVMYFGNTRGVLEFDGNNWKLIPVSNNSLVRSLAKDNKGRIYVGAKKEFGYLAPDATGRMSYVSLLDKISDENDRDFRDISYIFIIDEDIYFVARGVIFKYTEEKHLEVIRNKKLQQAFEIDKRIFVKEQGKGIVEFKNDKFTLIPNGGLLKKSSIRAVLPYKNGYLFVTLVDGLFLFNNKTIEKINTPIDTFLKEKKVITSIKLQNGEYAFGMFASGLLITDENLQNKQYINTQTGLQNNLVTKIYQDNRLNLWLSLGNGISEIMTSLPLNLYGAPYGLTETTYSAKIINDKLYLATLKGTFSMNWPDYEDHLNKNKFRIIGDPVQAFSIDTANGKILIAHALGVSTISNGNYEDLKIEKTVAYGFLRLNNKPDFVIVGTKKGLILLEFKRKRGIKQKINRWKKKKNNNNEIKGDWVFKNKINGFSESCRHIQIDKENNIWFSRKTKGLARLSLNKALDSVSVKWYKPGKEIPVASGNHVFKVDDKILAETSEGLYFYNPSTDNFKKDSIFNEIIGTDVRIDLLFEDKLGNIWFKQNRKIKGQSTYELGELIKQDDGSFYLNRTSFYKLRNNVYSISPVSNTELIIGAEKGFVLYDSKIQKDHYKPYNVLLRELRFVTNDSVIFAGTNMDSLGMASLVQPEIELKQFPFHFNDIRFSFSAPFFDEPKKIKFRFFLEGNDENWSDWRTENFKEYSNLREGDYAFHIIAKNIYEVESVEAVYRFTILPPWYRTIWAILLYVVLIALSILGIVRLSVRRLRKQKEYLEMLVKKRTAEINQAKEEIEATNEMLKESNDQINAKNKSITASITYAKRIQDAMLPLKDWISESMTRYFILFKPRDIVSGDFYWFAEKKGKVIIAAVDCTGHGVPGAFMSMIGSEILTTIVAQGITKPSKILDIKNEYVQKALKQDRTDNQDGMDMAICTIDKERKVVEFAGAKNPLIYIQDGKLFQIKGDKQSIGGRKTVHDKPFENHEISYAEHETYFYIFSDGYQDQFGGPKNRKFMMKRMKDLFVEHYKKTMKEQEKILDYTIESWMKDVEQTDDIIVIGFALKP